MQFPTSDARVELQVWPVPGIKLPMLKQTKINYRKLSILKHYLQVSVLEVE